MPHPLDKINQISGSQIAKALLRVRGQPLDFEGYKPMQILYDVDPSLLICRASRQIGKTVFMGAIITTKSILRDNFITLFISPLQQQTSRFSSMYLDNFFDSPLVKKYFRDGSSKKNVGEKTLKNGSIVYLSYVETESDSNRVRGISADSVFLDEIQDISYDALPVVYETLSASRFGFKRLMGTSKTLNNTLEYVFKTTSQCHWTVKCPHCGYYNIPQTFEACMAMCQRDEGPCCQKCKGILDMSTGEWIAGRPDIKDKLGFSLPQLIIPFRTTPKKWSELREKVVTYPLPKLSNEVFGLPVGIGGRILSEYEAMACCNPAWTSWDKTWQIDSRSITSVVLGVDWSVTASEKSFTVVSVLGVDYQGKCYLMYSQQLNGVDILEQVERVAQLYHQFNAQAIGSDRGVGVLQCQLLQQKLGHDKVFPINYVAAKHYLRYDVQGQYFAADRTMAMDTVFVKMKLGRDRFEAPRWEITERPFWMDCLSIFEEETNSGRRVFRHDEDIPDDSFHSVVFANLAHMIISGDYTYVDDISKE